MKLPEPCSICRHIPNECGEFRAGGELKTDSLPEAVARLQVVGAPTVKAHTNSSNSCLLVCPECGMFYRSSFEHEYLAWGSEDSISLVRLSHAEGSAEAKRILDGIEKSKRDFEGQSADIVRTLLETPDLYELLAVAGKVYEAQKKGVDVSFAIDAVIQALTRLTHQKHAPCPGLELTWILEGCAKADPRMAAQILSRLPASTTHPELEALIARLPELLESEATT